MKNPYARRLISLMCTCAVIALEGCGGPESVARRQLSSCVIEIVSLDMAASTWRAVEAEIDKNMAHLLVKDDTHVTRCPPLELALGEERVIDQQHNESAVGSADAPVNREQKVGLLIKATLSAVNGDHATLDASFHDSKVVGWGEDEAGVKFPEISLQSWNVSLEVALERWLAVSGSTFSSHVIRLLYV